MKLAIKSISSIGVEDFYAEMEPAKTQFQVCLGIGPRDDALSNNFFVTISTPEAIRSFPDYWDYRCSHGLFIVLTYDWDRIEKALEEVVESCEAQTWDECTQLLCRFFVWEYDPPQDPIRAAKVMSNIQRQVQKELRKNRKSRDRP